MKKIISIMLSLCLAVTTLAAALPSSAAAKTQVTPNLINTGDVEIDTDGSDGYSGDYVVIYNPSTSSYGDMSTGNMSGLIETEVGVGAAGANRGSLPVSDKGYVVDIDSELAEADKKAGVDSRSNIGSIGTKSLSFNVGDTHVFSLYSSYCPLPNSNVEFEVLAKGEHCYIWTPTSTAANVYPLDEIDESFAQICADEFDSKFALMQSSFGDHANGSQGDGRLNILYYNIDDGWTPGNGYVAGFFTASDLASNGMPCLNIDTYPGVYYVNTEGEVIIDVADTYGTMVHEYQHLINYSAGGSDTWINECMSAASEEICYPGSSISRRVQSWMNYSFKTNNDWLTPPAEHEYVSAWSLHNGFSMYDWSNWIETDDRLALYAQVSFFAQYIYTQYGNQTFRALLQKLAAGKSFATAFKEVTGQTASEFVGNFRVAMTANAPDAYDGIYGFRMQEGYNPADYHDVQNLYNLLSPVVFTGNSCSISGGGAITVKPVDGIYFPPQGADNGLKYFGVTLNAIPPEPVALTALSIDPVSAQAYVGGEIRLSALRTPENANNFEVEWTSSNPAVAAVRGNKRYAAVTGVAQGTATITARAHDLLNDRYYTASAQVTIAGLPSFDEAANVQNGTLNFTNNSSHPWAVDVVNSVGGASVVSTNAGVGGSSAGFSVTVNMNAGETMSFDWRVSSESNYDKLKFRVNNTDNTNISGDRDWTTVTYTAQTTGSYTFEWVYSKDSSINSGSDCGWVDNISIPGYIGAQYAPGDVDMDGNVTISDALAAMRYAMGTMQLTEQQIQLADVDGNPGVSVSDALTIMRMAIGVI